MTFPVIENKKATRTRVADNKKNPRFPVDTFLPFHAGHDIIFIYKSQAKNFLHTDFIAIRQHVSRTVAQHQRAIFIDSD